MSLIERCAGLPDALASLVEVAVAEVGKGGETPASFDRVRAWLEEEGAEQLIEGEQPECFVLLVQRRPFSDDELRSYTGLPDDVPLADFNRIAWARSHLQSVADELDGWEVPSIHMRVLETSAGRKAMLGYRIEIHGQGGPVVLADGVYRDSDHYLQWLRSIGSWSIAALQEIPDSALLECWED